jgi:NACHT domain-containing protein
MSDPGAKSGRLVRVAVAVAIFAAVLGLAVWLVAGLALGLNGDQLFLAVTVATTAAAILASTFGQPLFSAGLAESLKMRDLPVLDSAALGQWCVLLRTAVIHRRVLGARSQREQMLRQGVLLDLSASEDLQLRRGRGGRTRLRFSAGEPWSLLVERWPLDQGRTVILGEPGYGKTFSALALIEHINREHGRVAELFSLADWHTWSADRAEPTIEDWLCDQLIEEHPELTRRVAWAIVTRDRLMPIFDGLDEVPESARPACRDALEAYAGRAEPFRPFVVTCRQEEYFDLAPDWIGADRHLALLGLTQAQIVGALQTGPRRPERWAGVVSAVEAGHPQLLRLLRSPLRLTAAIEIYDSGNPQELFDLAEQPDAGEELWDLLLLKSSHRFRGAAVSDVRRWLAFIATSLRSHDRRQFWLHELYLYAAPSARRQFHLLTVGAFAIAVSVPLFLTGTAFGVVLAVLIVLKALTVYRRIRDTPIEQTVRGTPIRSHYFKMLPRALLVSFVRGCIWAVSIFSVMFTVFGVVDILGEQTVSLEDGAVGLLEFSAFISFLGSLGAVALIMAAVDSSFVAEEPPLHFAGRGPGAVTRATRNHGLLAASIAVVLFGVPSMLLGVSTKGLLIIVGVNALLVGWLGGLNAWAFHYWARWRIARAGLLPYRLGSFLEWAASDAGHLRASDAYEFRHQELRDYLAQDVEPIGKGNLSWTEVNEERERSDRARNEMWRGDRLMRKHDYDGARKAYLAAFKATPRDARALRSLNRALEKSGVV